ncbi:hypothetical protein ABBQ32_002693 [Trebouxia sp. C0010 RCD-2024]
MFHDLACIWQDTNAQAQRDRAVMTIRLGIDCFAMAHEVYESLADRNRCSIQPLNPESLQGTSGLHDAVRMQQGLPWKHNTLVNPRQLTRLTLSTEDSSAAAQAFIGTHAAANSYDLLAVQPTSERVLQQACTSLEVDIIAFDLAKRLPFRFKPGPLQLALKRGLFFEICYAPALREETARRNLFANALALARATGGKGIIISSGARSAFELRGPYDVINMATLFGLSEQDAKAALTTNCEAVLAHAQSRQAYRGTVLLTSTTETQQQRQQPAQPANTASQQAGLRDQTSVPRAATVHNPNIRTHTAGKAAPASATKQRKRKNR